MTAETSHDPVTQKKRKADPEAQVRGDDQHAEMAAGDGDAELRRLKDKWQRALAEAENARKRADVARAEGREHGIAVAVEALAPALDALAFGIEAARKDPVSDDPRIAAHLEGLSNIRAAFETGLKALGVRTIMPDDMPFDPKFHEATDIRESGETAPGRVLVVHRPGLAIGQRLIRPAHVTVSAEPAGKKESAGS